MAGDKSTVVTCFVFDFETGGLNCQKSAATQISLHAVRLDTFEVMDTLNVYISPYHYQEDAGVKRKVLKSKYDMQDEKPLMEYTEKALEYSAITMDMLEQMGVPLEDVCDQILEFVKENTMNVSKADLPILAGQNVLFDIGFLQQIMVYTKRWDKFIKLIRGHVDFWGNFQPYYVDTILLAQLASNHDRTIHSYKLEIMASRFGIEMDDAHDADADVAATADVIKVLSGRMRSVDGQYTFTQTKKQKLRDHFKI